MTALLKSHWREAREPGKGRAGKLQENGLMTHLELVHGYAATRLTGLAILKLVFAHEAEHPFDRGHKASPAPSLSELR